MGGGDPGYSCDTRWSYILVGSYLPLIQLSGLSTVVLNKGNQVSKMSHESHTKREETEFIPTLLSSMALLEAVPPVTACSANC